MRAAYGDRAGLRELGGACVEFVDAREDGRARDPVVAVEDYALHVETDLLEHCCSPAPTVLLVADLRDQHELVRDQVPPRVAAHSVRGNLLRTRFRRGLFLLRGERRVRGGLLDDEGFLRLVRLLELAVGESGLLGELGAPRSLGSLGSWGWRRSRSSRRTFQCLRLRGC